jgi:hypothetical protein
MLQHHLTKLEDIIRESGELLEGNCMYLHNSIDTHPGLLPKQRNLQRIVSNKNKILEIGFNAGHSALLFLTSSEHSVIDVFDLGTHTYTKPCFEYLQSHFPNRLHLPMGWGDSQTLLPQYVVNIMGTSSANYDLVHIDGSRDTVHIRNDIMYSRRIVRKYEECEIIINDTWIPQIAQLYQQLINNNIVQSIDTDWEYTPLYKHSLASFKTSDIAVLSLHIGEEFRKATKYSLLSKIQYCNRHGYDLIIREDCYDTTRPPAWSKVKLIQKYLDSEKYKYIVWIDADTLIMNPEIRLEGFIEQFMGNNDMLLGYDRDRFNTGVWFIRVSEWSRQFLQDVYEQEQFIHNGYWEQAAVIDLFEKNWLNAKNHITAVWHTAFNSYYYNYEWGHFLIHFPGCRPLAALELAFYNYCPVRKFEDTDESYNRRMHWIQYESREYENKKIQSGFTLM